jgi:hypothetical protein
MESAVLPKYRYNRVFYTLFFELHAIKMIQVHFANYNLNVTRLQ